MPQANVAGYLLENARRFPDRPALILRSAAGRDRSISFSGLWDRVDRISQGLLREGFSAGDRAIVMIPMSIDLYAVLLGILKMGGSAVFVDPWLKPRQISDFSAFASPTAYLGVTKAHLLRWSDSRLRRIPLAVTTGPRLGGFPAGLSLARLEASPGNGDIHPSRPEDTAIITFTTGSSGTPKGADRTHGFLSAQHAALKAEFPYQDGDVDMPMFPIFALNNLACGVRSVVPRMDFRHAAKIDAAAILDQMRRHGVTTCTASPPFVDRLAEHLLARRESAPPLRRIITGGAPVQDSQLASWVRVFPRTEIVVAYGSTEAEPVAHIPASQRLEAHAKAESPCPGFCAGRPIESLRARLIHIRPGPVALLDGDWSSLEVPPGRIGELVVAGEHVCRSYYRNPQAVFENKIVEPSGAVWHRMGDTGCFDPQGRFWLAGRVHSTIRRAGQDVHPQLVEQAALGGDPRIRRAAAVGLPDPKLGEKVVVVLETAAGEEVLGEARGRLLRAGQPADEVLLTREALPVDPRHNAKVDYPRLRERLLS